MLFEQSIFTQRMWNGGTPVNYWKNTGTAVHICVSVTRNVQDTERQTRKLALQCDRHKSPSQISMRLACFYQRPNFITKSVTGREDRAKYRRTYVAEKKRNLLHAYMLRSVNLQLLRNPRLFCYMWRSIQYYTP